MWEQDVSCVDGVCWLSKHGRDRSWRYLWHPGLQPPYYLDCMKKRYVPASSCPLGLCNVPVAQDRLSILRREGGHGRLQALQLSRVLMRFSSFSVSTPRAHCICDQRRDPPHNSSGKAEFGTRCFRPHCDKCIELELAGGGGGFSFSVLYN